MSSLLSRIVFWASAFTLLTFNDPTTVEARPNSEIQTTSDANKQAAKRLVDKGIAAQSVKDYVLFGDARNKLSTIVTHISALD